MKRTLEPEYMDTVDEASSYDAMDHRVPNNSFVDRLIGLGAKGRILDVGCGPGQVSILMATRMSDVEVVGLDAAKTMLDLAELHRRQTTKDQAARLSFVLGDGKSLGFPDGHFDAVVNNTVLHHIPDPLPFLAECWRVLRPGGVLLIRDLFRPQNPEAALALVDEHAAQDSPMQRELFRASLHAALTPKELDEAARGAKIEDFEITIDSDRHMSLQISART
ncbi:MAG: class I SAM-dependent methyltransferase [Planctomycetota bacterium]